MHRRLIASNLVVSALLLVPCWWLPRIAAGDLASHIYNVWLLHLIRENKAPGLWVAQQSTNILFDTLLSWLTDRVGMVNAQRLAVAAGVLLFFWAAYALVSAVAPKRAFIVMPLLAILAYGTVFHLGLFNYYFAAAFSLAALALLWSGNGWAALAAIPLLALAWLGQPLPPLWTIGVAAYVWTARRLKSRYQPLLLLPAVASLFILRHWLTSFGSTWRLKQILHGSGLDQNYAMGHHYRLITFPITALLLFVVLRAFYRSRKVFRCELCLQVYLLSVAGCVLIPATLAFPWYHAQFGAVPERLGWLSAVLLCALVATTDVPRWLWRAFATIAILYFVLLYRDQRALNSVEEHVEYLIAKLPPGRTLVAKLNYPPPNGSDVSTILDRACIGRCISFANYEPATGQFRVRAIPGNSIVAWSETESASHQYFSSQPDAVLYEISQCGQSLRDLCLDALVARTTPFSPANQKSSPFEPRELDAVQKVKN